MMAQAEGRSRPSSSCGWEEEPCEGLQALQSSLGGDTGEAAVSAQTQTAECTDAAVQCEPPPLPPADDLRAALAAPQLARFLANAVPRCEEALQQNELADVLADELAALVDEEAGELGAGAGGAAAASGSGSRTSGLVEHHSFSDLLHSKGRTLEAVQFHPSRRGVAAVACAQGTKGAVAALGTGQPQGSAGSSSAGSGQGHTQASSQLQKPHTGCILVWSHADAMHPEAVLQAPADVFAFAFHPTQPHWLAAGLATGQVALFNLQQQPGAPAAGSAANTGAAAERGGLRTESFAANRDGASDTTAEGGGKAAVLLPLFLSLPNASHQAAVTDLQWMPGAAVGQDGRLEAVGAGAAASPREGATSSSALTAAPAATDSCNLFATTAADGSILMWDMRIRARHQRKAAGAKDDEQPDWKPALALAAASTTHQPLPATRFCLDARGGAAAATAAAAGRFLVGSLDGELAAVDASCFSLEHKGNVEWSHNTVALVAGHAGRVVSIAFSPLLPDTILVVGGCGFVVWRCASNAGAPGGGADGRAGGGEGGGNSTASVEAKEEAAGSAQKAALVPVFESPFPPALYTCGCWSNTKPGTILLGRQDGRLEAWDLLDRMHQAVVVAPVAPCALTALALTPPPAAGAGSRGAAAQLVGVGDAAGTLRLLELPRALRRRGHAEVKAIGALLSREQERVAEASRRTEQRAVEQRAAAAAAQAAARRKQQEASAAAKEVHVDKEKQGSDAAEQRYQELEERWRERMAAVDEAAGRSPLPPVVAA